MKIAVVAGELPHPEGTAVGRDLWCWCEGIRALGHQLEAWVWMRSPSSPRGPIPGWCRYEPFQAERGWRSRTRAVVAPRQELARAGWQPPEDAVAVADHLWSFAAVARAPRSVATFHFRTVLDAWAVRRFAKADVQMARAEQRAGRRAALVLAYSQRVGRRLAQPAEVVPLAYPVPSEPLGPVEEPVAALLADWSWPPNQKALQVLLRAWPTVRQAVPGARLLLAGRNLDRMGIGTLAGVDQLGAVAASVEVLGRAGLVAFPCPASSGPKIKVLEAMAHGLPVVTTTFGVEGVVRPDGAGAVVSDARRFAGAVAQLLQDPARRAELGASGRAAVAANHSPLAAAQARIELFSRRFGPGDAPTVQAVPPQPVRPTRRTP